MLKVIIPCRGSFAWDKIAIIDGIGKVTAQSCCNIEKHVFLAFFSQLVIWFQFEVSLCPNCVYFKILSVISARERPTDIKLSI